MIIALDGPSAAGKGVIGKKIAHLYRLAYLDTGLLYRIMAYLAYENNFDIEQLADREKLFNLFTVNLSPATELYTDTISKAASKIATNQDIRDFLTIFQKNFAATIPKNKKGVLLDGRDIGTVILPHACVKLYITAQTNIRAERRYRQLVSKKIKCDFNDILKNLEKRDQQDQNRPLCPLKPAKDAFVIDTSFMTIPQAIQTIKNYIDSCLHL